MEGVEPGEGSLDAGRGCGGNGNGDGGAIGVDQEGNEVMRKRRKMWFKFDLKQIKVMS